MAYLTTLSACSNLKGAGKDDEGEGPGVEASSILAQQIIQ